MLLVNKTWLHFICEISLLSDDDDILILKAQLGYLKKKLASMGKSADVNDPSLPIVYVITPTHTRAGTTTTLWRANLI